MTLDQGKPAFHGRVSRIAGDAHLISRLTSIGITENVPFQTVRNNKRMPVLIYLRETLIALNRDDAKKIEVEQS